MGEVVDLNSGQILESAGKIPVTVCYAGTKTIWIDSHELTDEYIGSLCSETAEEVQTVAGDGSIAIGFHEETLDFVGVLKAICSGAQPSTLSFGDPSFSDLRDVISNLPDEYIGDDDYDL
jgi:hypothetical protein